MQIRPPAGSRAALLTVAAASLCLTLTGCTASSGTGSTGPASSTAAPAPTSSAPATVTTTAGPALAVQWMDGYCQAVNEFREDHNRVLQAGGGEVNAKMLAQEIGPYTEILTKAIDRLQGLPAAPVPEGDAAKKTFLDNYTAARDQYAAGKAKLDKSKSSATANSVSEMLIAAQGTAMKAFDPVGTIMTSKELSEASASAKHCTSH